MKEYQSLSHMRWDCKYHIVFIPKRRKKRIFGALRKHLGELFHELAGHGESQIVEGHLMSDHVHMCISIPPKYSGCECRGLHQGQERDSHHTEIRRSAKEFHRRELLGSRLLRFDGRLGRVHGSCLHPKPRARGRALRPNEARRLVSRLGRLPVFFRL